MRLVPTRLPDAHRAPAAPSPLEASRGKPFETEDEVLERARQGDLRAWELVAGRHQETVFRVAYVLIDDAAEAAETTRSSFIRAYHALPELRHGTQIRPWLLGIAATRARAQRRALAIRHERDTRQLEAPAESAPSRVTRAWRC